MPTWLKGAPSLWDDVLPCKLFLTQFSSSPLHPLQAKWHFHFKIASPAPLWIESNYAEKHWLILSEHNSFPHLSQSRQVSFSRSTYWIQSKKSLWPLYCFKMGEWLWDEDMQFWGTLTQGARARCRWDWGSRVQRVEAWDLGYVFHTHKTHTHVLWSLCHLVYPGPKGPF